MQHNTAGIANNSEVGAKSSVSPAWPPTGSVFHQNTDSAPTGAQQHIESANTSTTTVRILDGTHITDGGHNRLYHNDFVSQISKKICPKWDGKPSTWANFWKSWEYYWSLRKDFLENNQELKKWLFVDCLPNEEGERARHLIIGEQLSFEELVQRYHSINDSFLTRYEAENNWKRCIPVDKKWKTVDLWYSKWMRLAAEVPDLTEKQMIEQFDIIMSNVAHKVVREYRKEELMGKKIPLQQRWSLITNELNAAQIMTQMESLYRSQQREDTSSLSAMRNEGPQQATVPRDRSRSPGGTKMCWNCEQTGHVKANCPFPPRSERPSSRASSRDSEKSAGSSRSNISQRSNTKRVWNGEDHSRYNSERRYSDKPSEHRSDNRTNSRVQESNAGYNSENRSSSRSYSSSRQHRGDRNRYDNSNNREWRNDNPPAPYYEKPRNGRDIQRNSDSDRNRYNSQSDSRRSPRDRCAIETTGRNSPHRPSGGYSSGYRSGGSNGSQGEDTDYERDTTVKRTDTPSRSQLLQRQRSNQCLTCGESTHHTGACPRSHRGRSPTPQRQNRDSGRSLRPRVEFDERVSRISETPLTSVREGDVDDVDEQIVDAYMAARSITGYASASDFE